MSGSLLLPRDETTLTLWGRLVKTWASGVDHLHNPNRTEWPRPDLLPTADARLAEFKQQLVDAGIGWALPDIQDVAMVQSADDGTLFIRLPAIAYLQRKEAELAAGGSYGLPDFYARYFGAQALDPDRLAKLQKTGDVPADMTMPAMQTLINDLRVGEYSMNNCAG